MSKYYKAEDVAYKIAEQLRFEAVIDSDNAPTDIEPYITEATAFLIDLPTIEVSEDCISKGYLEQELEHYIMAEREVKTDIDLGWIMAFDKVFEVIENAPSVIPKTQMKTQNSNENSNEDCISRADLIKQTWKTLWKYQDDKEKQFLEDEELEFGDWFIHRIFVQDIHGEILNDIVNAPSVVPKQTNTNQRVESVGRAEGEWKITNTYKDHSGRVVDRVEHTDCGYIWNREMGEPLHNYCPNCGAKMKGASNADR